MKFTETDIRTMVTEAVRKVLKENMENELQAYHGTTHLFDKFDTDFIGTGESTQVYGWGLYMTAVRETGDYYAAIIANKKNANDKSNKWLVMSSFIAKVLKPLFKLLRKNEIEFSELKETALKKFIERKLPQDVIEMFSKVQTELDCRRFGAYIQNMAAKPYEKYVYTVELPDTGFIDWNLTDRSFITKIYNEFAKHFDVSHVNLKAVNTFGDLYSLLCGSKSLFNLRKKIPKIAPKDVSQFLNKLGFVGISVPIGNKHGGDGLGYNYVIFNKNDIEIKKVESI